MLCLFSSAPTSGKVSARLAIALGLSVLIAFSLLSCRSIEWFLVKRSLREKFGERGWVTTQQLADWLADKNRPAPVLLDVRTRAEFEVSHLPGARQVDPKAQAKQAVGGLPENAPVVTYCSAGYRSGALAERLRAAGYTRVYNLEGSIFQWANEQRPLVRDGQAETRVHPYNVFWGRLLEPRRRAALP